MLNRWLVNKVRERRAQILLPSVLLAPIFILVIYLLFETAKVSNTKIRHQFALDNAAYSQWTEKHRLYKTNQKQKHYPLPHPEPDAI